MRLCSGKGAYEAIPEEPVHLDLEEAARRLVGRGLDVVDARVMLLVHSDPELTISQNGRLLLKTRDPEVARRMVDELWTALSSRSRAPSEE